MTSQRTRTALPHQPAALEADATDFGADMAGNVVAPLAPVEAGPAENPAAGSWRRERDAEFRQKALSCGSQRTAFVVEHDEFTAHERIRDRHAERAGEMVITGACKSQRLVLCRTRLVARRRLQCRHRLDAFQHFRNQRRSDAVVAVAPLPRDGEQPRPREFAQVAAGGCARHVRQPGELAARECLAAHQGRQHHGARGVADQRCNLDHVGSGNHAAW